jgi:uncharacterized protein (TIGR02186 family)
MPLPAALVSAFAALALAVLPAAAQTLPDAGAAPDPATIQIGLSTNRITITADFSGADLTVFGAVDNADPLAARQRRYDVIVTLEGPPRAITVRRKDRVLGMWINTASETFLDVPVSYSIATSKRFQDIAQPALYRQLALGADSIRFWPEEADDPQAIAEFAEALRRQKAASGLYTERVGDVEFLSQNLFRATVTLAPNIPLGTHNARAYLFKDGKFLKSTFAQLFVRKSGFEQTLFRLAQNHGAFFGVCAVALAVVTGWLGRLVFRRD